MRGGDRRARQVPSVRPGFAAQATEIDRLHAVTSAAVTGQIVTSLQRCANRQCAQVALADWCLARYWHESGSVRALGEARRRFGPTFEHQDARLLDRQVAVEAEHVDRVGRLIARLGAVIADEPPLASRTRSTFLQECLERHRLAVIAACYIAERAALGGLGVAVGAGRRYGLPEIVRTFEQILKEDRFHAILGRVLLEHYATTAEEIAEVGRAMRGMAGIVIVEATGPLPGRAPGVWITSQGRLAWR